MHSELEFGEGVVRVSSADRPDRPGRDFGKSPRSLDGVNTQSLCLYVDDVDAHCEASRAAGARITSEPKTKDDGEDSWWDRGHEAVDLEGHHWSFLPRMRG